MENKIIKFCAVGLVGTILDVALLYFFVETFNFSAILGNTVSFSIVIVVSFFLHKIWTFRNNTDSYLQQFLSYFFVSLIGLGISNLFLWVFMQAGLWYLTAKVATIFLVVFWSFSANNFWTFRQKKSVSFS